MKNKITCILLLAIMLLSPFAFAEDVRLVKVSDLKPGDVILDVDGNIYKLKLLGDIDLSPQYDLSGNAGLPFLFGGNVL